MMPSTVHEYLENPKNPKHRDDLTRLRTFLRDQLPDAVEDLKYGMPTYSQGGDVVVAMASQKNYLSLYMDVELVEEHKSELGNLDCGKSCIRFKRVDDLPLDVIATILHETVEKQAALRSDG
jgi:uncharacterized protein YdhG (YjbR/CyaY superfamily)